MNINYKKYFSIVTFLILIIFMVCAAQAQTPTYDQWGLATPRIYSMSTYGDWTSTSSYFAVPPTITANDTLCYIGATQTLVGKTLTSPTLTTPTLTTPVITGVIDASDGLTVDPGAGIDVESAGILDLGDDTATTINIGGTAATTLNIGASGTLDRTFNIGTGTSSDTVNIGTGGTVADDINIGDALADVDITGASDIIAGTGDALTITANAASTWSASAGDLTIDSVAGNLVLNTSNLITTDGSVDITGNVNIDLGLDVTGDINADGSADIAGGLDVNTGITVPGNATGLDTDVGGGALWLGYTNATGVSMGLTAATTFNIGNTGTLDRTFNIGCGASSDTFNIGTGGTVADDINIGDSLAVVDVSGSTVTLNATTLTLTGTTTNITGGSGSIDYDNFDVDSSGNVEASGQIHSDLYHWSDEFDYEASGVELGSGLQADFWTVSGTNDAAGMYLYTAGAGGTLDVSSCVAEDDSSAISGLANYRVNNDPIIEFRFKISDVSNCFAAVGFAEGSFDDKGTVDDDVCLVYIDYDSADTTPDLSWNVWCADTNVDVSGDLGVDATSDTYIIAKIDLTDTEQPRIWIDGTEISAALILGTVQAGTTLFPYAHVQTNYTAAKEIVIDYIETWQDR